MSVLAIEDRSGTTLLTITVPGLVLRLVAVLPVAVALGALHAVAPEAPWWPSVAVGLLAVVAAELPDSGAGLVALGGLVAWWLLAAVDPAAWWSLLVAACCLVSHVALALAAAGPSGCAPTPDVLRRLAVRCGTVLAVTAAVALVVDVAEEWDEPPSLLVGVTLGLVGALPWLAARRTR